ncbi:MAG TPA: hypothetical protein VFQ23_00310 [Anaerolineales bacterium]|nr:hypothetical protein [Anaerolineales bacterium]
MKRKFLSILTVFLLTTLLTSTVSAGGNIKLSGAPTSRSPLHLDGYLTGVGGYPQGVTVELIGSGVPVTLCTNPGGNQAPGQNPPKIQTAGTDFIGPQDIQKNGKAPVNVVVEDMIGTTLPGNQGGCPNNSWTAEITNIAWTDAVVLVTNNANGNLLLRVVFTCFPAPGIPGAYDCRRV